MTFRRRLSARGIAFVLVVAVPGMLLVGCKTTPYTDAGIHVGYSHGGFHVDPYANIGIYGRP